MSDASSGKETTKTEDSDEPARGRTSPKEPSHSTEAVSEAADDNGGATSTSTRELEEPPLPEEEPPPLPGKTPPVQVEDDGWAPVWDDNAQAFYFFNRFTSVCQWENPRMLEVAQPAPPGVGNYDRLGGTMETKPAAPVAGGYDPSIHGDYDPNADYAKAHLSTQDDTSTDIAASLDPGRAYAATGSFNRFTGKWQAADLNPEKFNDENKSRRQMNAFFDVDAAANSHDGKSLKAERSGKKLSKNDLKAYKDKRREKKEEKRRAWLKD